MKILYDNILKYNDSILATNQSDNRPVENILHNFLELPFEAIDNTSSITVVLDKDYSANCFAYGFHNLNEIRFNFFDVLNNLIWGSSTYIAKEGENIIYFDQVDNIRKIVIPLNTIDDFLYVGNLFFGLYLDLPDFLQAPDYSVDIRDSVFESGGGQSGGNRQRNLENFPFSFPDVDNFTRVQIIRFLNFVQRSVSHYIHIYDSFLLDQSIFWAKVASSNISTPKKRLRGFRYNIDISWRQAR